VDLEGDGNGLFEDTVPSVT